MIQARPFLVFLPAVLLLGTFAVTHRGQPPGGDPSGGESRMTESPEPEPAPPPQVVRRRSVLSRNSTLQEVLLESGLSPRLVHDLVEDAKPVYDLNRVKSGHHLTVEQFVDGSFHALEYEIDEEGFLLVEREGETFVASIIKHELRSVSTEISGEIRQSLWKNLISQGEKPQLVQALYQILQWDVDFTAVWPGDSFKVIVEKKYLEDRFVKYGEIRAVEFVSGGRAVTAFLFENPSDGRKGYFDSEGRAVRKAFLKVPFDFDPRITSSFSRSRYHPILKRRRPHLGVDYGAPVGTPVLASASGRVTFAGRSGGFGKLVKVRHANGYVTSYAHLSRIEVKTGQRVEQGERIGRVGATGLATGPHLDYRIQDERGRFLNPRQMTALPSDTALEGRNLTLFASIQEELAGQLARIPFDPVSPGALVQAD